MSIMAEYSLDEFLQLPTPQVADLIRGLTLGFPIDGTRRWYLLHYPQVWNVEEYKALTAKAYVESFRMLFDHGVETILVPAFGGELMSRGEEYVQEMMEAMARLAQNPTFDTFYREYNVRVRFYGDWRRQIKGLPGEDTLVQALDTCPATRHTGARRLLYGLWADDMLVSIVDDLARSNKEHVEFTRAAIVSRYYGEYINPTDIYIGFGRPTVFDVPMLVSSQTDLYYTVVPSLDLDAQLFRMILWDHFVGRWTQQEWDSVSEQDFRALRTFYQVHHDTVLGLGEVDPVTRIWQPRGLSPIDAFRQKG